MAVTQEQIDAMNQAIADGVRQVTLPNGQSTTYNTSASLIQARDDLVRQLAREQRQAGGQRRNKRRLLTYVGREY